MEGFTELLTQGAANPWLLLPTAVLLGALHGLEPGHSKTMIAAFIIAIRGTIPQAVLLGLSAAASHVVVVWVLALAALTWGDGLIGPELEGHLLILSGVIVLGMAAWMLRALIRTRTSTCSLHSSHAHRHHGHHDDGHDHDHGHEHSHHHHGHTESSHTHGHDVDAGTPMDAHALAHARDIEHRFSDPNATITTGQIVLFGLTGGLLPCSAAITVLIVCLQLDKFALGVAMVGAFSVGLALALIAVGVAVAWGIRTARRRWPALERWTRRAPYFSVAVISLIGLVMLLIGLWGGH